MVKQPKEFIQIVGLIIPGGENTTNCMLAVDKAVHILSRLNDNRIVAVEQGESNDYCLSPGAY